VTRRLTLVAVLLLLPATTAAAAAVRVVDSLSLEEYADRGAIGLVVPGAGATVTRDSALNALLTGRVKTSYLGGTPPGQALIRLGEGPPPDTLLVLPPPGTSENDYRYPIAVVGAGASGLLTSDSTRIDGLVSIADVATGRVRWVPHDDPLRAVQELDDRIARNDRIHLPLTVLLVVGAVLTALARPRLAPRVFLLALAGNLWLAGWWVVAVLALAALLLPLGLACAVLVGAYLAVLGVDPDSVALSPLGPSQAGRFYGFSNLLASAFLVPALLGAALLGRAGVLVGAAALLTVGGARFGADGGGLLVLLVGYAVLAVRLSAVRVTAARMLAGLAVVVVAAVAFVLLDAALGGTSHVTDAAGGGPGDLAGDLWHRIRLSWARATGSWGAVLVAIGSLAVLARAALRRPRLPITDAFLAAIAVSVLVNDTPGDVLVVGAAAVVAVNRWEGDRLNQVVRLRAMRRISFAAALVVAALALVAVGCESPEEECSVPACDLEGNAEQGKQIFASSGCGSCHTLSDAGTSGTVGPNLDDAKPSFELAVTRITEGRGAMPTFKDQLSEQQIADVAQYVVDSTGG
jgi:mono/diheme cytochrome c family protein